MASTHARLDELLNLKKQANFYFSDVNLAQDVFLRKVAKTPEGFASAACLLAFNHVRAIIRSDVQLISALKDSPELVGDEKARVVRREAPVPETVETDKATIYVNPIPPSAMVEADCNVSRPRVHRHVLEHVAAFATVPQQACARRASKALCEAVRAESMEDLLHATVLEHRHTTVDAQLVFVVMSRALVLFKSADAMLEWCGGLTLLYEELQQRFPHAAAIGVSARLAAIRPCPFASGLTATTCILFSLSSTPPAHAVESVVLEVRNPRVLVRAPSHSAYPIVYLDGATPEEPPHMLDDGVPLLSSFPSICYIVPEAFRDCRSLRSVCLANLPQLVSICYYAFSNCVSVSSVDLSGLSSLRSIGECAFRGCISVQSLTIANLPLLESIGEGAFAFCEHLTRVDLSGLPSLRTLRASVFQGCSSLQSFSLVNLQLLEHIDDEFLAGCRHLISVDLSRLPSLHSIGRRAFYRCSSLQSVHLANLPVLESIEEGAFCECVRLTHIDFTNVNLSGRRSLHKTRAGALSRMQVKKLCVRNRR